MCRAVANFAPTALWRGEPTLAFPPPALSRRRPAPCATHAPMTCAYRCATRALRHPSHVPPSYRANEKISIRARVTRAARHGGARTSTECADVSWWCGGRASLDPCACSCSPLHAPVALLTAPPAHHACVTPRPLTCAPFAGPRGEAPAQNSFLPANTQTMRLS